MLSIDPNHLSLSFPLAIHKIANIKIPILINLYPDPISLIKHQLALIYLPFRAYDNTLAMPLAIDYCPNV